MLKNLIHILAILVLLAGIRCGEVNVADLDPNDFDNTNASNSSRLSPEMVYFCDDFTQDCQVEEESH